MAGCGGGAEIEAKVVDQATNRLRAIRDTAVEGCWGVWNAAAEVLSARAREEHENGRRAAAIQRSASRRAAREAALLKRAKTMERTFTAVIPICSEPETGGSSRGEGRSSSSEGE